MPTFKDYADRNPAGLRIPKRSRAEQLLDREQSEKLRLKRISAIQKRMKRRLGK